MHDALVLHERGKDLERKLCHDAVIYVGALDTFLYALGMVQGDSFGASTSNASA